MSVLTPANLLTLLRMGLIPVFAICMFYRHPGWAFAVFAAAGITDALDGFIARTTGQFSTLGAWLDPMADKLLLLTVFVALTVPGLDFPNRLPIWLTVLVISRDVGIVLTVAIVNLAVAHKTFRPSLLGKTATVVYILTAGVTLFFNYLNEPSVWVRVFVYLSLVITLLSGVDYLFKVMRKTDSQ